MVWHVSMYNSRHFCSALNTCPPTPLKKCWFMRKLHVRMTKIACKMTPSVSGTEHSYSRKGGVCTAQWYKVWGYYIFSQFLASVPGTFGDYCMCVFEILCACIVKFNVAYQLSSKLVINLFSAITSTTRGATRTTPLVSSQDSTVTRHSKDKPSTIRGSTDSSNTPSRTVTTISPISGVTWPDGRTTKQRTGISRTAGW